MLSSLTGGQIMANHRAPGIEYHRVAGFSADLFRCPPWRATLSVPACADRWRRGQVAKGEAAEELRLCRQCPTGAAHAGEKFIHRATAFGNNTCPRCRRGTMRRMIGNRVCINCYNRQLELFRGQNRKGTLALKAMATLALVRIGVRLDPGSPEERTVEFADIGTGPDELRYHVERTHAGEIEFVDPGEPGTYPAWGPSRMAPRTALAAVAATSDILARAAEQGITEDSWRDAKNRARPH
jgi:hypothetical protein